MSDAITENERLRELLELGQQVAREILGDSTYSGDEVKYWNGHGRSGRLALFAEGNLDRLRAITIKGAS